MRRKFLVGLIISIAFLWLAVRKVNLGDVSAVLTNIQIAYLVPAFLLTLAVCLFRALRWRLLFLQSREIAFDTALSVIMIGFLANNLLPARLGDIVMAHLIGKKEHISRSMALGTIFLDRVMDVATLIFFLLGSILLGSFPFWVKRIGLSGMMGLLVVALVATMAVINKDTAVKVFHRSLRLLPQSWEERLAELSGHFIDGLSILKQPIVLLKAFFISVLIWSMLSLGVYLIFLSFHFSLGFGAALAVLVIVNLGLVIPSAPGFVGTFQFFCSAALGLFQISESEALGFSIIYHLSQFFPTTLVGFYYLNRENLSLSRLPLGAEVPMKKEMLR